MNPAGNLNRRFSHVIKQSTDPFGISSPYNSLQPIYRVHGKSADTIIRGTVNRMMTVHPSPLQESNPLYKAPVTHFQNPLSPTSSYCYNPSNRSTDPNPRSTSFKYNPNFRGAPDQPRLQLQEDPSSRLQLQEDPSSSSRSPSYASVIRIPRAGSPADSPTDNSVDSGFTRTDSTTNNELPRRYDTKDFSPAKRPVSPPHAKIENAPPLIEAVSSMDLSQDHEDYPPSLASRSTVLSNPSAGRGSPAYSRPIRDPGRPNTPARSRSPPPALPPRNAPAVKPRLTASSPPIQQRSPKSGTSPSAPPKSVTSPAAKSNRKFHTGPTPRPRGTSRRSEDLVETNL